MKVSKTGLALLAAAQLHTALAREADSRLAAVACKSDFVAASENYPFLRQASLTEFPDTKLTIESLDFTRLKIFDESNPGENNALFRWANRFHILTRPRTIEQLMLFAEGEVIEGRLLDETARILRDQDYFFDADLRLVSNCEQRVGVEVITKDTWSLTPNLAFDRSGGDNTFSFGVRDSNFLGLGKQFAIARREDIERESDEIRYEDPNVFGSWVRNRTVLIDSDDGSKAVFDLGLPFYALDSRRSWQVLFEDETRRDAQFFLGDEISEVEHDIITGELAYGWSKGLTNDSYLRWTAGFSYRRDRFAPSPDLPTPILFPADRELVYPFLQLDYGENRFATAFNLDELYRTEDLYLGQQLMARVGYASEEFGSDQNRVVLEGSYSSTLVFDGRQFWQHSVSWEALLNTNSGHSEDLLVSYSNRYFFRHSPRWAFFASINASYANNLSRERQIFMGGDRGVRAFDNRLQVGDRSAVLSLEERVYTDLHLFNLIRIGAAAFLDVGRAWEPGEDSGLPDAWLANVGLGLRLMSSKAASSRIAHLDIAFPVTNRNHPAVDRMQIVINIKGRF
jgi:hypothetical protein